MRTRSGRWLTVGLASVALVIISFAIIIQFERASPPSTISSVTSTSSRFSVTSTSSSSSSSSSLPVILGFLITGFEQSQATLLASPNANLNYTLLITRFNSGANQVKLSAMSIVPGVSVVISPGNFTFFGDQEAVTLRISVNSSVNLDVLPIQIGAATGVGAVNRTFEFRLVKGLIVLIPGPKPLNLRISVGQTVTWLNLTPPSDEGLQDPATVKLLNGSVVSPLLHYRDLWSHQFTQAGTFAYGIVVTSYESFSGEVTVS